jgi:hypothetical protein
MILIMNGLFPFTVQREGRAKSGYGLGRVAPDYAGLDRVTIRRREGGIASLRREGVREVSASRRS